MRRNKLNLNNKLNSMKFIRSHFIVGNLTIIMHYVLNKNMPLQVRVKDTNFSLYLPLYKLAEIGLLLNYNWKIISVSDTYLKVIGPVEEHIT